MIHYSNNYHSINCCDKVDTLLHDILLTGCQKYVAVLLRSPTPSNGESPRRGNSFSFVVISPAIPLQTQSTSRKCNRKSNCRSLGHWFAGCSVVFFDGKCNLKKQANYHQTVITVLEIYACCLRPIFQRPR